jgi:hypothetical protein
MTKTITITRGNWQKWLLMLLLAINIKGLRAQAYFIEKFSSATGTTMPAGWTNAAGTTYPTSGLWDASDPGGRSISGPGFTGQFVILDSDALCANEDAILTTPAINLSASITPYLQFSESYNSFTGQIGTVQYSINGGAWTTVDTRSSTDIGYPSTVITTIPVPAVAGQANVKFRWTFESQCGWWWAIDEVKVGELGAPVITTGTSTAITTSTVRLNANIKDDGGTNISRSGILLSTTTNSVLGDPGVTDSITFPVISMGAISLPFSGLSSGMTYYYRAYAVNASDTGYGLSSSFTTNTSSVIPTVLTIATTNIGTQDAPVGGNIVSDGGDPITSSGIVYATNSNPQRGNIGVVDSTTIPLVLSGNYGFTIKGLTDNTKYYFRAYAINSIGTGYSALDSFTTMPIYSTLPYSENFDGTTTYWTASSVNGGINNWALGTPAKTYLNAAYSTPNAFVTNLAANYSLNAECIVLSPQFNFTAQTTDPVLIFKQKFDEDNDPGFDGGVVEISINGGPWTILDDNIGTGPNYNTTNSVAWYNDDSWSNPAGFGNTFSGLSSGYSSAINGWISSSTTLTGAAGAADVKIRFHFGADGTVIDEGWAIDNIEIVTPTAPVVATSTVANLTNISVTLNGNISSNGLNAITKSGVVYATTPDPVIGNPGVIDSTTNPLTRNSVFSVDVTGLVPSTLYHYKAYATNAVGTTYGADHTFTTLSAPITPTVLTGAVANVKGTSATLSAKITSNGGEAITQSGIVVDSIINPVIGGFSVIDSSTNPVITTGQYSLDIVRLAPSTKYYYRAYAINNVGISYGTLDSFTTLVVYSILPYSENFDGTTTSWTALSVNGGVNDWALGTPAKTYLNAAYSTPNAFVTSLAANYSVNAECIVLSPQFNFTTQTTDPVFVFKQKFDEDIDPGFDGGVVEISINGGPWTILDDSIGTGPNYNTTNSVAWYNNDSWSNPAGFVNTFSGLSSGYSSAVNGWVSSSTTLTGAAGAADVKIRFHFSTDGLGTDEGWAIDNIEIVTPTAPVVATSTVVNLTNISATLNGNISSNGLNTVTKSGVVYATTPNPVIGDPGVIDSTTNPLAPGGIFSVDVTGLIPSTLYHYKAYATNAFGTTYGTDHTFTTLSAPIKPTVLTGIIANVEATTATLSAKITSNGGDVITQSGIVVSTTPNPAIGGFSVIDSSTTPVIIAGQYSLDIAGLASSAKYYYRAYAINNIGVGYSTLDSFTTMPIYSVLPYSENFDGPVTVWSTAGINGGTNAWIKGSPGKGFLNGTYSGANAFVTYLTGDYMGAEDCVLRSPQFDFSTQIADPIIRFKHRMDTDADPFYDGGVVEISINNGAWTRLDANMGAGVNFNTPNSYAWYNAGDPSSKIIGNMMGDITSARPGADANGWIESATRLTGAANQSNVKVRFRFAGDNSFGWDTDEGWEIDNIEVVAAPQTPTLTASSVLLTNPGANSINVGWTNGDGNGRLVVARLTTTGAVAPVDNIMYTPNVVFASLDSTGLGNYVVYSNNTSAVVANGLQEYTDYTFDVYEYNGKYMHVKFAPASFNNASTLPVKLLQFTATVTSEANGTKANDVQLNWTTASEQNNKGFEVERSVDGHNFDKIGFVKGAGNSNKTTSYVLTDKDAFARGQQPKANSQLFYRLKQIDLNGKYTYSNIVRVNKNTKEVSSLSVFPNPFTNNYTIAIHATQNGASLIQMMDMQGRLVMEQTAGVVEGANTIEVNNLAGVQQGIYFVKITTNGETQVMKLTRQ